MKKKLVCPSCSETKQEEFKGRAQDRVVWCPNCEIPMAPEGMGDAYSYRVRDEHPSPENQGDGSKEKKYVCLGCSNYKRKIGTENGLQPRLDCGKCGGKMVPESDAPEMETFVCLNCSHQKQRRTEESHLNCEECGDKMVTKDEAPRENQFVCQGCSQTERRRTEASRIECSNCGGEMKPSWPRTNLKLFICPACGRKKFKEENIVSTTCNRCGERMQTESKTSESDRWKATIQVKETEESNPESSTEEGHTEEGHVYVMVNSEKPDLVKIGMTKRDPEKRAKELRGTGVSMPYIVAYEVKTEHPKQVEKAVHNRLSHKRVNPDREFFKVKPKRAIGIIEQEI
jgi:DNA-directed RNA polymerase subunit RPC12/RpoP